MFLLRKPSDRLKTQNLKYKNNKRELTLPLSLPVKTSAINSYHPLVKRMIKITAQKLSSETDIAHQSISELLT